MSSGNLMQRVFDVLFASPAPLRVQDIAQAAGLPASAVHDAIARLRQQKCLHPRYDRGVWTYTVDRGAQRPVDRRGRRSA